MDLRLIKKENLDKTKWNSCVHYALNGNVFGYKWFLDSVSKEWDALIEGDYESILPLFYTFENNFSYHQSLLRESGIYSIHLLSKKRIENFIEAIPAIIQTLTSSLKKGFNFLRMLISTFNQKAIMSFYCKALTIRFATIILKRPNTT